MELDGNSLPATQVISRVLHTCAVEMPLQVLFASPTVAAMAGVITRQQVAQISDQDIERLLSEDE